MQRNIHWKKHVTALLSGSMFLFSTAMVMAAPVELSLEESVALALKNNPSIKVADADKEKAAWAVKEAKGSFAPSLNLTHTSSEIKTADHSVGGSLGEWKNWPSTSYGQGEKYDNKITLTIPLYTGGKAEGTVEKAKISYKVSDLSVAKAYQQVKQDATTGYYSVLQARNLVKVAQESVDMLAAHLKNVQAQYEVGTVAKSDVLRSEVELANAQQNLIKAQNTYELAVSSLNNVMGLSLDTELAIKEDLKYEKYSQSLKDSIGYAMVHRPEVIQADANIDAAQKDIQVAKSGYRPSLTFQGAQDWNKDKFPGDDNSNWSLSLIASWTAFDSGVTDAKVKQADAATEKAKQQAKQTRDSVQLEVRQNYLSMQEAEKRIDTSQVAVEKAEEDFKIAQVRYSAGVGTNIDVIDAQVALTQAKTNYIQAMYDYNTSRAKLDKAMGIEVTAN